MDNHCRLAREPAADPQVGSWGPPRKQRAKAVANKAEAVRPSFLRRLSETLADKREVLTHPIQCDQPEGQVEVPIGPLRRETGRAVCDPTQRAQEGKLVCLRRELDNLGLTESAV
jgi:hypothetical protein